MVGRRADDSSFQTGRSHILLVTSAPGKDVGPMGVVSLEDVVEVSYHLPVFRDLYRESRQRREADYAGVDRKGDYRA